MPARTGPDLPTRRLGPRPLALHLVAALTPLLTSSAGLAISRTGSLPWRPELLVRAQALLPSLAAAEPGGLARAVEAEARRRFDAVLTGIERYRGHPYRRDLPDPPVMWAEGASRLFDYGSTGGSTGGSPGGSTGGRAVLLVPSLINRGYILDLSAERSLVRWLSGRGFRPLLLDWGRPGPLERRFTTTDYVAGRLERALDAALAAAGGPLPVVGYCMGGTLAAALAERRPRDLSGLALLAAPWDFHTDGGIAARRAACLFEAFAPLVEFWGELPTDALQVLFASLDPGLAARKFARFGGLDPEGAEARAFVALEDWLNDGVPLAGPVARDCLVGWYGGNDTARGRWLIAGRPVDPAAIRVPVCAIMPARDRIVPPACARALADAVPDALLVEPALGHIGMIVARDAERQVWRPLADWLAGLAGGPRRRGTPSG